MRKPEPVSLPVPSGYEKVQAELEALNWAHVRRMELERLPSGKRKVALESILTAMLDETDLVPYPTLVSQLQIAETRLKEMREAASKRVDPLFADTPVAKPAKVRNLSGLGCYLAIAGILAMALVTWLAL